MQKRFSFRGKDFLVHCEERTPQDPSWYSFEDEAEVRERDWNVGEGDYVLDIGSAYGSYMLTALSQGAAFVYGFNPNGRENTFLYKSLRWNDWSARADILEAGLYSQVGWLHESGNFSATEQEGYFHVIALDDLNWQLPDGAKVWVKIDVEGAEVEVLRGMTKFLARYRPTVLVENHTFIDGGIPVRVMQLMHSIRYQLQTYNIYHDVAHAVYKPSPDTV